MATAEIFTVGTRTDNFGSVMCWYVVDQWRWIGLEFLKEKTLYCVGHEVQESWLPWLNVNMTCFPTTDFACDTCHLVNMYYDYLAAWFAGLHWPRCTAQWSAALHVLCLNVPQSMATAPSRPQRV